MKRFIRWALRSTDIFFQYLPVTILIKRFSIGNRWDSQPLIRTSILDESGRTSLFFHFGRNRRVCASLVIVNIGLCQIPLVLGLTLNMQRNTSLKKFATYLM